MTLKAAQSREVQWERVQPRRFQSRWWEHRCLLSPALRLSFLSLSRFLSLCLPLSLLPPPQPGLQTDQC